MSTSSTIMPNMYETTYSSHYSRPIPPRPKLSTIQKNKISIYALESQSQSQYNTYEPPLPPLDAKNNNNNKSIKAESQQLKFTEDYRTIKERSNGKSPNNKSDSNEPVFNVKANVQRSGFWCENPVSLPQAQKRADNHTEMRTTNQEMFEEVQRKRELKNANIISQIAKSSNSNGNGNGNSNGNENTTPYAREPVTIPYNNKEEILTTQQAYFQKVNNRSAVIPSNVVMEPTGFQRGSEGTIDFGNKGQKSATNNKMSPSEIEKLKYRDPLNYLNAKNENNPYISMNQLSYQKPQRTRPF